MFSFFSAMDLIEKSMTFFVVVALLSVFVGISSAGKFYKVGDDNGWTIIGNVNYSTWASSKKFKVGDSIAFVYNKQFHDVLQVKRDDYRSCNAASPIAKYSTGNDTVQIKRKGHYFFICGAPGHCVAGQRVDIRIPKSTHLHFSSPRSSPNSTSPSMSPTVHSAPAPNSSDAADGKRFVRVLLVEVFAIVLHSFFFA